MDGHTPGDGSMRKCRRASGSSFADASVPRKVAVGSAPMCQDDWRAPPLLSIDITSTRPIARNPERSLGDPVLSFPPLECCTCTSSGHGRSTPSSRSQDSPQPLPIPFQPPSILMPLTEDGKEKDRKEQDKAGKSSGTTRRVLRLQVKSPAI
jgi:hypothetical protein